MYAIPIPGHPRPCIEHSFKSPFEITHDLRGAKEGWYTFPKICHFCPLTEFGD